MNDPTVGAPDVPGEGAGTVGGAVMVSRRKSGQRKGGRAASLRRKGLGPRVAAKIANGKKRRNRR